jgi:hypothetical protein
MINKVIIFLIRKKLGLKKYDLFQFTNQKSDLDKYYFTKTYLRKIEYDKNGDAEVVYSGVSLNWLLDSQCKVKKVY